MDKKTLELDSLVKVKSSNIELVGYKDNSTYVTFKSGKCYVYPNTSVDEFEQLVKAESVGSHFAKSYRGKMEYSVLEDYVLKRRKMTDSELLESICANLSPYVDTEKCDASKLVSIAQCVIDVVRNNT